MAVGILQFSSYAINSWAIPIGIVVLIITALSLKLLYHKRLERTTLGLNLLTFFILVWQISFFLMQSATNETVALWWAKAAYLGVPFIAPALYLFVVAALNLYEKHKRLNGILWLLALFFSMVITGTDLIIHTVKHFPWGYYPQYTAWSVLYLIPFVFVLGMSYYKLRQAYGQEACSPRQRLRIRSFLLAFGIGGLAVIDYLPKFNLAIYPAGYLAILACVVMLARTIAKYQLFDITPTFAAQSIIDTMDEALITIDAEGIIRLVNRATTEMFGRTEQELLGSPCEAIFDEDARAALRGNNPPDPGHGYELSYRHPDGSLQILSMAASSMKDASGNMIATVCTMRNITRIKQIEADLRDSQQILEHKVEERTLALRVANEELIRESRERLLTEQALRKSEEMYRLLTEIAPNAISVADASGIMRMINRRALELYGHTDEAEVLGRSIFEWVAPEVRQQAAAAFVRLLKDGTASNVELPLLRKNGLTFPGVISGSVLHGPDGGPQLAIIVTTDVTQQKQMEEERLKFQKLEAVGTLAGGIAHDFNNLLQGVFGYISLAQMQLVRNEKAHNLLEQAEKALSMSINLTGQLLTFSKGGKPVKKRIALPAIIDNAVRFSLSGSSSASAVTIGNDLWPIEGDEGQIGQVLQNIVLNAGEAMPGGGTVEIRAENDLIPGGSNALLPEGGRFVRIDIKDSGSGILPEHIGMIFDPYFTTKQKGSGLGLATAYSIVRNHGGLITVESAVGKGTAFSIYLPACEAGDEQKPPHGPPVSGRKGRVLVMDDEQIIRDIAGEMLRVLGHEFELAANGEEAIFKYRDSLKSGKKIDVVILDLTVRGGMGGEKAIKELLKLDPGIITVVSSGYVEGSALSEYGAHGFRACLKKPYNIDALNDTLSRLLP